MKKNCSFRILFLFLTALLVLIQPCIASESSPEKPGNVHITLEHYRELLRLTTDPKVKPREAPAGYALGKADVRVHVSEKEGHATADVTVNLSLQVLEDDWVLVPILPAGTPVRFASVAGKTVEFISTPAGLSWGINHADSYTMTLNYSIDAIRSGNGFVLAVPIPEAAAITLNTTLPGSGLDATVIPSAGTQISTSGEATIISSTIPTSRGVQISWQAPGEEEQIISRASYTGILKDEAVLWTAEYAVELLHDETFTMPLLPRSVTLRNIEIDGEGAPILVETGSFATLVKGRGKHIVTVDFQVPVLRSSGPPQAAFQIPEVPVSKVELRLPGRKEVAVNPGSHVTHEIEEGMTIASVNVPMTSRVTLSWSEAIPDEIKAELRANASLYHAFHAEEGVLFVSALLDYEITRGETNLLEIEVPRGVQVNRISSPTGGISDWRVVPRQEAERDLLHVFLDRQVRDTMRLHLLYDRSIQGNAAGQELNVPLLRATKVHRQRGMVALLSSKELTLNPLNEDALTRVGENQLPAFVKDTIDKTIAHTFKYVELSPEIVVRAETPERKQGKFDAVVNTLVSLSDVTLKGSATIDVSIKSGAIDSIQLALPKDVNFLSLTAPSLRIHKLVPGEEENLINVEFTQELEGQFRIEVNYERIMTDEKTDTKVPTLLVKGAEVEQGRIAVEALSAVEVQAAKTDQLSSLDPSELPQQLVLKTTNPILLAYKYVYVDPPYDLSLRITRHKEIDVQSATIDAAVYRTLYTRDGLAVTTAQFTVRNSRQQFLRVQLPEGSKVWSATVNGQPEKPAKAESTSVEGGKDILIKIIHSTTGFPVTLIYQTPVTKVGVMGSLHGALPRPKRMVVTTSRWDVYLPSDLTYASPSTNLNVVQEGVLLSSKMIRDEVLGRDRSAQPTSLLQLQVPTKGIRYSFEKLYANQADEDAYFSIPYVSESGGMFAQALALLGALLIWLGVGSLFLDSLRFSKKQAGTAISAGLAIILGTVGYLSVSPFPSLLLSGLAIAGLVASIYQNTTVSSSAPDTE